MQNELLQASQLKKMLTKSISQNLEKKNSTVGNRKFGKSVTKVIETDSSDLDFTPQNNKKEEKRFLPCTFEGMMESFGVTQQRRYLQDQFYSEIEEMNKMLLQQDIDKECIQNKATEIGDMMKKQIEISMIDPAQLKNNHNSLFLSLMERLQHLKEKDVQRNQLQTLISQFKEEGEK